MDKKRVRSNFLLLLAATIWGFAFVAQRIGSQYVGALTFNGIRFGLGCISLIPLILYYNKKNNADTLLVDRKSIIPGIIVWYCTLYSRNVTTGWNYLYNCWKSKLYYRALYGYCTNYWSNIKTKN